MHRQAPAATSSPDLARGPLPRSGPAASTPAAARTPCWDRPNVPAERQAPAAAPSPDLARGPLLALTLVVAAARRPLLLSSAPVASNLPVERMPGWDRPNAPAERQAPMVARPSPGLVWSSVLAAAPVPLAAQRQLLVLLAPVASSLPAERTPCWDRRGVAAQRQTPAEPPLPRLVRAAAVVWQPAGARQPGPAAPNRAAAQRPCSDRYGAAVERQAPVRARVPQRVLLQAQAWTLEQAAAVQTPARCFREQRSPA